MVKRYSSKSRFSHQDSSTSSYPSRPATWASSPSSRSGWSISLSLSAGWASSLYWTLNRSCLRLHHLDWLLVMMGLPLFPNTAYKGRAYKERVYTLMTSVGFLGYEKIILGYGYGLLYNNDLIIRYYNTVRNSNQLFS